MNTLLNIFWLGIKELKSLLGDKVMVLFVIYAFTLAVFTQACVSAQLLSADGVEPI